MKLRNLLIKLLLIYAFAICAVLFVFFSYFVFEREIKNGFNFLSGKNILPSVVKQEKAEPSFPVRLKIPSIKVDALVENVGLTSEGVMGVPKGPDNVGWFSLGRSPGEVGSAVIDGHAGYRGNKPAVFDNLYKLKKGDKIHVLDSKGTTVTFVVRELKSYNRNANASKVFTSSDGLSHLNLVTCSGDWNLKDKTHVNRLVVFADRAI